MQERREEALGLFGRIGRRRTTIYGDPSLQDLRWDVGRLWSRPAGGGEEAVGEGGVQRRRRTVGRVGRLAQRKMIFLGESSLINKRWERVDYLSGCMTAGSKEEHMLCQADPSVVNRVGAGRLGRRLAAGKSSVTGGGRRGEGKQ